jgi:hypothetical protein
VIEVLRIGFPKFVGRSRSSQKGQIRPHECIGVYQVLKRHSRRTWLTGRPSLDLGSHQEGGGYGEAKGIPEANRTKPGYMSKNEEKQMKLQRQSGRDDGSASKGVNAFLGGPDEESSVTLSRFREQFGCSNYRLAELSEFYRPYLHRIENGIKANLSRTIVAKIAAGLVRLGVGVLEGHRFLVAAAHVPIFLFARVPSSTRVKKPP